MKEIVINKCYGGFSLSHKAIKRYAKLKGFKLFAFKYDSSINDNKSTYTKLTDKEAEKEWIVSYYKDEEMQDYFFGRDIPRDDKTLIRIVKELGNEANGGHAELKIIEIPDDVKWTIEEYDGIEWVAEEHRTWG